MPARKIQIVKIILLLFIVYTAIYYAYVYARIKIIMQFCLTCAEMSKT